MGREPYSVILSSHIKHPKWVKRRGCCFLGQPWVYLPWWQDRPQFKWSTGKVPWVLSLTYMNLKVYSTMSPMLSNSFTLKAKVANIFHCQVVPLEACLLLQSFHPDEQQISFQGTTEFPIAHFANNCLILYSNQSYKSMCLVKKNKRQCRKRQWSMFGIGGNHKM